MQKLSASTMTNVRPTAPDLGVGRAPLSERVEQGQGFRDKLSALTQTPTTIAKAPATGPGALKFSNHAIDRMQARGIRFSPEDLGKIQGAVAKAAGKGSKDALLITDNAALIVSVKDNTVVTVMDKASLKDNVFTKIDSTVMI